MNQKDKKWLLEEFPNFIGRTLMKETLDAYLRAEQLIDQATEKRRISCKCHLRDVQRIINNKFSKWREKQNKDT